MLGFASHCPTYACCAFGGDRRSISRRAAALRPAWNGALQPCAATSAMQRTRGDGIAGEVQPMRATGRWRAQALRPRCAGPRKAAAPTGFIAVDEIGQGARVRCPQWGTSAPAEPRKRRCGPGTRVAEKGSLRPTGSVRCRIDIPDVAVVGAIRIRDTEGEIENLRLPTASTRRIT